MNDLRKFNVDEEVEISSEWAMPDIDPFTPSAFPMRILSFDQTISSTGWALILLTNSNFSIEDVGTIKTPPSSKGHIGSILRGVDIGYQFRGLLDRCNPQAISWETPPVASAYGRNNRPESSLLAAMAVMNAWSTWGGSFWQSISAQKTKKRWTGSAKSDKAELKRCLQHLFPQIAEAPVNNEHTRDAIALGLVAAETGFQRYEPLS